MSWAFKTREQVVNLCLKHAFKFLPVVPDPVYGQGQPPEFRIMTEHGVLAFMGNLER